MTETGYSVVEDAVECALVVASAVDAIVSIASLTVDSSAHDAFETNASTKRYVYCVRTARRYAARSWTVTGELMRGGSALRLGRVRLGRAALRRGRRSRTRAILLASQVLNI